MTTELTAPQRAKGVVHKQIADIAKGCAKEQWETLAKQNSFYKAWPNRKAFVAKFWPEYLPVARQMLTLMLGDPKRSEEAKEAIYNVLLLDGAVNPKTMAEPAPPVFTFSK